MTAEHAAMRPRRQRIRPQCRTHRTVLCDPSFSVSAGIVLTNDGHAILREIDVNHPAAKVDAGAARRGMLFSQTIMCDLSMQ